MKNILIAIYVCFIILSCKTNDCDTISITCFTHYQINQSDNLIIGTDKLPPFYIYNKPNGKVIFNLRPDEESGWEIEILEKKSGYFKIENAWKNDISDNYKYVWIKKGSVGLNINNYDNQKVPIYSRSNAQSEIIGYIENAQTVSVLDACKNWAYIKGVSGKEEILGWLEPRWQCGNPLTTCN